MSSAGHDRPTTRPWTVALAAALATAEWVVFRPGILSSDSIDQYGQALRGDFNNWHPPLMALVLAGFLRVGLGLSALVWLQAWALIGGVLVLARRVVAVRRGVADGHAGAGLLAGLLVLSPLLSPSVYYAVTFWKDVWTAIAMLWLAALYLGAVLQQRVTGRTGHGTFVALAAVGVVTPCIRHNALVLLAPLAGLLWRTAPVRPRPGRALLVAAIVGLSALAPAAVERVARAHDGDPSAQVLALDLVGLWLAHPELRAELPHTSAHVHPPLVEARYEWGSVEPLLFQEPCIVARTLLERAPLRAEWWSAWRRFPLAMAAVKWRTFWPQLGFTAKRTHYWFEPGLWSPELGLRAEGWLAARRAAVDLGEHLLAHEKSLRWLGRVHGVWLLIALALLAIAGHRRRRATWQGLAGVPGLAVAYAAGFVLATTMPDYRFLYPATLLTQTLAVAMVVAGGRRPDPSCSWRETVPGA